MFVRNKEITATYIRGKAVTAIYKGAVMVWEAVRSCFGRGYWIDPNPWVDEEGWRNE